MAENPPLPPDHSQDLQHLIGANQSNVDLHQIYLKNQQYADDLFSSLKKNASEASATIGKSQESLETFFKHLDKSAQDTAKGVKKEFKDASEEVAHATEKSTERAIAAHKKHKQAVNDLTDSVKNSGSLLDSVMDVATTRPGLADVFLGIKQALAGLVPELAALGAVAGTVKLIIDSFVEISDMTAKLNQLTGGNSDYWSNLLSNLKGISHQSHLTEEQLEDLTIAFYGLGGNVSNSNKDFTSFLTVGARAVNFFHMSTDEMASTLFQFQKLGYESTKSQKVLDSWYDKAKSGQLTLDEYNQSITEGTALWREFGSITGRTMDQFVGDLIDVKGLFKGLNLDTKDVGNSMSTLFGNGPAGNLRAAALMSNELHMTSQQALLEQLQNPAKATQDLLKAGLMKANDMSGGTIGLSADELVKQFGAASAIQKGLIQRQIIEQILPKTFNLDPGSVKHMIEGYQAARVKNPQLTIEQYFNQANKSGNPVGQSLEQAERDYMRSASQVGTDIANQFHNFFLSWTQHAVPAFDDIIKFFGSLNPVTSAATNVWHTGLAEARSNANGSLGHTLTAPFLPGTVNDMLWNSLGNKAGFLNAPMGGLVPSPLAAVHWSNAHPMTATQAFNNVAGYAQQHILDLLSSAQFGLESGWGKAMPQGSNNPFGMKWYPGDKHDFVQAWTSEQDKSGHAHRELAKFIKFNSLQDAFQAHEQLLLHGSHYKSSLKYLQAGDVQGYFSSIGHSGYATDVHYADKLLNLLDHYLPKLEQIASITENDHTLNKQQIMANKGASQHALTHKSVV